MEAEYLTQTMVLERGWSQTMVSRFLGAPDATDRIQTSHGKTRRNLYRRDRVVGAEAKPEFAAAMEKAEKRRACANPNPGKARETRINKYTARLAAEKQVLDVWIERDKITMEQIRAFAREDIERVAYSRNNLEMLNVGDERNIRNYLRHYIYEMAEFPHTTVFYERYRSTIDELVEDTLKKITAQTGEVA